MRMITSWSGRRAWGLAVAIVVVATGTIVLARSQSRHSSSFGSAMSSPAGAPIHLGLGGPSASPSSAVSYRVAATGAQRGRHIGEVALQIVRDQQQVAEATVLAAHSGALETAIDAQQASSITFWRGGHSAEAIRQTEDNISSLRQLQAQSYSAGRAARIQEYRRDVANFRDNSAGSNHGRAYGLRSNDLRRARARNF